MRCAAGGQTRNIDELQGTLVMMPGLLKEVDAVGGGLMEAVDLHLECAGSVEVQVDDIRWLNNVLLRVSRRRRPRKLRMRLVDLQSL